MTNPPDNGPRPGAWRRKSTWLWLAAYAIMLAMVVGGMLQLRSVALETMDTPKAHAQWQEWRESAPNQQADLPVRRRPPTSDEPPTLVLLRDHFGVMLGGAVLFSSLLFAAITIAVRGALWRDQPHEPTRS